MVSKSLSTLTANPADSITATVEVGKNRKLQVTGDGTVDSSDGPIRGSHLSGAAAFVVNNVTFDDTEPPSGSVVFSAVKIWGKWTVSFKSTSVTSLSVIAETGLARIEGVGTYNKLTAYPFLVRAFDAGVTSSTTDVDTFRIRITDAARSRVYDNGVDDDGDFHPVLSGTGVVIDCLTASSRRGSSPCRRSESHTRVARCRSGG